MSDIRSEQWFREWWTVFERNLVIFDDAAHAPMVNIARGWNVFASRRVARFIRARVPYQFDGEAHVIADWDEVLQRGYGACADGSAIAAALFTLAGKRPGLCHETVPAFATYAHARILIGRFAVEPWPEQRRPEAKECSTLVDVLAELQG